MSLAGDHIGFVIAAYAVTAVVLVGLAAAVVLNDRAKARRLAALEARGVRRRRSSSPVGSKQEH